MKAKCMYRMNKCHERILAWTFSIENGFQGDMTMIYGALEFGLSLFGALSVI